MIFGIKERGSNVTRELLGGLTTFMSMSYIIFVQVYILSGAGMDSGGVIMATCISTAVASILMGLLADYPIALAPGMGENYFFVMISGMLGAIGTGVAGWKMGLALVAVSGVLFLLLSVTGVRAYILKSIPKSLKFGIPVGIGLLIALLGFKLGNVVKMSEGALGFAKFVAVAEDGTWTLNSAAMLTLFGLMVLIVMTARRIHGAVLWAILINTVIALCFGLLQFPGAVVSLPSGLQHTAGGFLEGFAGLGQAIVSGHLLEIITFAFILFFMDLFDTVGTLVGVSSQAGLLVDGQLPRANRAMASDAVGTIVGAGFGTSTVTSYIESATGVAVGARTGLAAVFVGVLFCLAMFFQPVIEMIGGGTGPGVNPMVAPALIFVGVMMLKSIQQIEWVDITEYFPAVLVILVMPLTMSISNGMAIGFVSYAMCKLFTGRARECSALIYVIAALFILRYVLGSMFNV